MFDKIGKFNKWRKTQAEVKKQQESVFVSNNKGSFSVLIRGDKRVEKITIDGAEQRELKEFLNDSFKMVDKKLEKKLRGSLGSLEIPGLT